MSEEKASEGRFLSPMEYGIWLFDKSARSNFLFVAEISGRLTKQALKEAAKAVQGRHPMLRARITVDKKKRARFEPCKEPLPVRVQDLAPSRKPFVKALEKENHKPFDTEKGPLCRLVLFNQEGGQSLVVTLHHSIADGVCASWLMEDVLAAASGSLEGKPPDMPLVPAAGPAESLFEKRFYGMRAMDRALGAMTGQSMAKNLLRRYSFPPRDAKAKGSKRTQRYILRTLDPEEAAGLAARARQEQTSIHAAVAAAQLLAMKEEIPGKKAPRIPQLSLVNLRSRLPEPVDPRVVELFISSAESVHSLGPDKGLWEVAREVKAGIENQLVKNMHFIYWPSLMKLIYKTRLTTSLDAKGADSIHRQGELTRPAASIISNIGKVGIKKDYGPVTLDKAYFLMSVSGSGIFSCSANAFDGRIFLNFTHASPTISRERAQRMANKTCELLRAAL